jgi:hypothetical protein
MRGRHTVSSSVHLNAWAELKKTKLQAIEWVEGYVCGLT